MPLVGANKVREKIKATFADLDLKAKEAVFLAVTIGAGHATAMVPVDTGNLVNSRFTEVNKVGNYWGGRAGFTASYAAAVHRASGKLKGQPRAHFGRTRAGVAFGGGTGVGTYWAPAGEPQFLKKGFEENMAEIRQVIEKTMTL